LFRHKEKKEKRDGWKRWRNMSKKETRGKLKGKRQKLELWNP
jgi:hypothetical protein